MAAGEFLANCQKLFAQTWRAELTVLYRFASMRHMNDSLFRMLYVKSVRIQSFEITLGCIRPIEHAPLQRIMC